MKYPFSATAGSTLFYALLLWESSTNPTNLHITEKKKTSPSPIYCTHMRLIIDWLFPCYWYFDTIKASAMKDVHLVRFAHSCKNFLQAHEKSQQLPGWRTFAFIAIFRCSLSHLQNLRELREITGWAIFHDTWHFRFFFWSRWRLIRNPVADFNKFMQLKLRKITSLTIFRGTCDICYSFSC